MCTDREKVEASGFTFDVSEVDVDFVLTFDRQDVRDDQPICSKLLYK